MDGKIRIKFVTIHFQNNTTNHFTFVFIFHIGNTGKPAFGFFCCFEVFYIICIYIIKKEIHIASPKKVMSKEGYPYSFIIIRPSWWRNTNHNSPLR